MKSQLLPQEIRHLIDQLNFETSGRYDIETHKWTYPQKIVKKLERMLRQSKPSKRKATP